MSDALEAPPPSSLLELRVLDGPNLYLGRPAIKLTLDVTTVLELPNEAAAAFASSLGLARARTGTPASGFRQRFAARAVARLVRRIAAEAGTTRLAVRARPSPDLNRMVVAFPWRRRGKAEALGLGVASVLDALASSGADGTAVDSAVASAIDAAAGRVRAAPDGDRPIVVRPRVPVVAITGTNGKTTTARLVAHMGRGAGLHVGWSSTDGIYIDGEEVEAGDYSGPSGAQQVLAHEEVQLAVTETARGGILLRGLGVTHNDVSVVTNVTADHLGLLGVDTLDQLAEVKAVITRVTRPEGWVVVNGDDPRAVAMRTGSPARPWVFSRHADSPSVREVLSDGGRATTVIDGWVTVLQPKAEPDPLVALVDVPMSLCGLSRFNVENALAAVSAALGVGLERDAVVDGLTSFAPGPELNPGRMNVYSLGDRTIVVDLAHNEAGLEALLEIMAGLRGPGGRLLLGLGTAGDRTDEMLTGLGELAARHADWVVIVHKDRYLRGRAPEELDALYQAGASAVGVHDVPSFACELDGLQALVDESAAGDVVGLMCHQDREDVEAWLLGQGATVDNPETLRAKVTLGAPTDTPQSFPAVVR